MATPPFLPDETLPGSSDLISAFPAVEQSFRDIMESWMLIEHNTNGTHKLVTLDDIATPTIVATLVGLWQESGVLKTRFAAGAVQNLATQEYVDNKREVIAAKSTASGTFFDFSGLATVGAVKKITCTWKLVSLTGGDSMLIQIGPTAGVQTISYGSTATASTGFDTAANGFVVNKSGGSGAEQWSGSVTLAHQGGDIWLASGSLGEEGSRHSFCSGLVTLTGGALDVLRMLRAGTNTFDGGSFGLIVER